MDGCRYTAMDDEICTEFHELVLATRLSHIYVSICGKSMHALDSRASENQYKPSTLFRRLICRSTFFILTHSLCRTDGVSHLPIVLI